MRDILGEYTKMKMQSDTKYDYTLEEVIHRIKNYLVIYDLDYNTNYYRIFEDLYLRKKELRLYSIAVKHNLDIKTLYNFRRRFNELANKLL